MQMLQGIHVYGGVNIVQMSREVYRILDTVASALFPVFPFALLEGFAFKFGFLVAVMHSISFALTDFGDSGHLWNTTIRKMALRYHVPIDVFVGLSSLYIALFMSESDGVSPNASMFYLCIGTVSALSDLLIVAYAFEYPAVRVDGKSSELI
eukprot:gnl/TRDRNA2_/TRDRNA2_157373_c0_seq5.p1 gnl/TRDRNA2_/TRDRNA2_157373_c0~~gnl/TRDRNA2_/TRDRNA2_157373_c0_seq5.p1  ORF type:complete len:152 (+),score=10.34 gnl/TRDRNA2_/TRDRNA2_157373_c0_seq5:88-543(+)